MDALHIKRLCHEGRHHTKAATLRCMEEAQKGATLHQVKGDSVNGGSNHLVLDEVRSGTEVVTGGVDALRLWNTMVAQHVGLRMAQGVLRVLYGEYEGFQCSDDVLEL
ncbi:hypothetical protein E2C01_000662 [Portunus trituberculatus]|uniref:Uncharacterized protein n=1 Tax=Portunus trituberculatus TaxID=210409 RepID=A0A5B7CEZ3_PORTR|nr:hypothetical protein [Portunus trituberculatus]